MELHMKHNTNDTLVTLLLMNNIMSRQLDPEPEQNYSSNHQRSVFQDHAFIIICLAQI